MAGVIALIPARGGSRGIKHKNLRKIAGLPLVVRSIRHAQSASEIAAVYVSTDAPEIADVAVRAGAQVIERPADLAGDTATTESAVEHALTVLRQRNEAPEVVVLLQCTSPFRSHGQLSAALARFFATGCDSMLSVVRDHGFLWEPVSSGTQRGVQAVNYDPSRRPRRQDCPPRYRETGSFYIFRSELFQRTKVRLGGHIEAFEVPFADAMEIDEIAELYRARREAAARAEPLGGVDLNAVSWLVFDVDGTLTDGRLTYGEDGIESKRFSLRDGHGIALWRATGGRVALITGEESDAVARRARKLHVDHLVMGCRDKAFALTALQRQVGLGPESFACMGDDLNDLPMLRHAALFAAPSDAHPQVIDHAHWVSSRCGGDGAARELIDSMLAISSIGAKSATSANANTPPELTHDLDRDSPDEASKVA